MQRAGLGRPVPEMPGRAARVAVYGDRLREMPAGIEIPEQRAGELDGVAGPAVLGHVHGDRDQVGPLGIQPGPRLGLAGQGGNRGVRRRYPRPAMAFGGKQGVHRGRGGVEVVVEQPGQGLSLGLRAVGGGKLAGVAAEQVVHAVPDRPGGLDHGRVGQRGQALARLAGRDGGQRGDRVPLEVGARMQPGQPEGVRGPGVELPVGPGERGADVGGRVTVIAERVQGRARGQFRGDLPEIQVRAHRRAGGDDGQREREARARRDDLRHRAGVSGEPVRAEALLQQLAGLAVGQHVQQQRAGGLGGHQPGELVAAGDDDPAGGGAGQQRPHLCRVPGVVKQHQHPLPGQQAAVQAELGLDRLGPLLGRDIEGVKQHPDGLVRRHRCPRWVEAAQVHVELPVGELPGDLMRPVHRQRGLPDPGRAADRGDDRGPAGLLQHLGQGGELVAPPDEGGHRRGQVRGHDPGAGRRRARRARCRRGPHRGPAAGRPRR